MSREPLIRTFFKRSPDPLQRDRIGDAARRRYALLRAEGRTPDGVFTGLQAWIGGDRIALPAQQSAVLAALAFLFQECDIFDRPPDQEAT